MPMLEKQLGQGRFNNTSNLNVVYTVPPLTTAGITAVHMCNTTNSDVTVRLMYPPSGGIADETTAILWDFTIPANDYHSFSPAKPHYIEAGGGVVFQNSVANAITVTASGVELT